MGLLIGGVLCKSLKGIQQFLNVLISGHPFRRLVRIERVDDAGSFGDGQTQGVRVIRLGFHGEGRDHVHKFAELFPCRPLEVGRRQTIDRVQRLPKALLLCPGEGNEFVHGRFANASRRIIDHAFEALVVAGVHGQSEVRQEVLDFLSLVKGEPAINPVGHIELAEAFFKRAGLRIGAVEDGEVLVMALRLSSDFKNAVGDKAALVVV